MLKQRLAITPANAYVRGDVEIKRATDAPKQVNQSLMKPTDAAPALNVAVVPVTPFQQNASIVWCTVTRQAAIVDPGGDVPKLLKALTELKVTPVAIWLTHGHIDHAGGATELAAALKLPILGPQRADQFLLDGLPGSGMSFGITGAQAVTPDRWLEEGETVALGDLSFDILHVPGHTPGHLVFFQKESRFLLAGDTLFAGSIGRTDFGYGDHDALVGAIRTKVLPLGDDVTFLPGHGPASTLGEERQSNPFIQEG
jgi:hydroxyacylglutathione hydrolase